MSDLPQIANNLRQLVVKMITQAGSGHPGGSLGLADIFATLYFSDLFNLDPNKPNDPNRDRIIVSNGHVCPVWYAALAAKGYFPEPELETLRQFNSRLQGHPHKDFSHPENNLPGVENTAGPLGQGMSFAAGLALGFKTQKLPIKTICFTGDGELNEGQSWEALMFVSKYKLSNLTYIIDRNDIQIDGFTHDVMPLNSLKEKLNAFDFLTIEIDGHNFQSIQSALTHNSTKPKAIIAQTIPGKGVSFMENKFEWHGKAPTPEQLKVALKELA